MWTDSDTRRIPEAACETLTPNWIPSGTPCWASLNENPAKRLQAARRPRAASTDSAQTPIRPPEWNPLPKARRITPASGGQTLLMTKTRGAASRANSTASTGERVRPAPRTTKRSQCGPSRQTSPTSSRNSRVSSSGCRSANALSRADLPERVAPVTKIVRQSRIHLTQFSTTRGGNEPSSTRFLAERLIIELHFSPEKPLPQLGVHNPPARRTLNRCNLARKNTGATKGPAPRRRGRDLRR